MEVEECFILKCCLALLLGGALTICWVLLIGLCLHLAPCQPHPEHGHSAHLTMTSGTTLMKKPKHQKKDNQQGGVHCHVMACIRNNE